jgi:hypothetical protein
MSTTNIKTLDYNTQKWKNQYTSDYNTIFFERNTKFPEFGINMGNIPSNILSNNSVDTESFLRGTYFNNLEKPRDKINVSVNDIGSKKFFDKPSLVVQRDIVVDTNKPDIFRR